MRKDFTVVEEDEIDLRPYIMTVLRHWKLIVGITVAAAGVAAGVSLTTPTTYEATSTVAIAPVGAQPTPQAKAYTDLATSDNVVSQVAQGLASASGGSVSATELKGKMKAAGGSEPRLVSLKVQDTVPDRAVKIADLWTSAFVQAANSTLNSPEAALKDLDDQSKAARDQLRQAEDDLAAQESRNSVQLLAAQVTAQRQTLTDLYSAKATLHAAANQANSLKSNLRQLDPSAASSPSDDLAVVQIESKIIGTSSQVQLSSSLASGRTVAGQLSYVDSLSAAIGDQSAELQKRIADAQAALLDTQKNLQLAQDEQASLVAKRDNLRKTIADLDLKASQLSVAAAAGTNQVRPLTETAGQVMALPRGTTKNVAVAGLMGLLVGWVAAFGMEFLAVKRKARQQMLAAGTSIARASNT